MQDRVCFFTKYDLSVGYYLEMAEKRIQEVSEGNVPTNLEGIIELWHIRRMIEEDCRLQKWTDTEFDELKLSTNAYNTIIANYFNSIDPQMLKCEYEQLNWTYKETFWQIIDAYKLYKLIVPEILHDIISANINYLRYVLRCKGIVEKFKNVIRDELLSNVNSAHIILDRYVTKSDSLQKSEIFLPSNLTLVDKEQIINNYLDSEDPNLNYVRLITQIKDEKDKITLSPKTKLKAEKLVNKLNDELMNDSRTSITRWSIKVQFINEEGIQPVNIYNDEQGIPTYTYSVPYIKECNNIERVRNCITLFGWMNRRFLVNLINKKCEVNTIEPFIMDKGKYSYPSYMHFNHKNSLSLYELYGYNKVLKRMESSFEKELKLFYERFLQTEYDYLGLPINFPMENDSSLNKCRVLCPELDAIVKQYNTFVEEDEINQDLIRLSKPIKVEEGKSLLKNKYYEINVENEAINIVLGGLFRSGNSLLYSVEPFKDKNYHSLLELLEHENEVLYSNYDNFQKPHLDFLIQQNIIGINDCGQLYIINKTQIEILKSLWEYGVCSYWHYDTKGREILDDFLNKDWLITDDHLLSSFERDYFSYYLDNMKYTNGMAYRNHYMHGSTPPVDDEKEHATAYLTILKLFAILILKIEDDLWLARRAAAIYVINNDWEIIRSKINND